MHLKRVGKKHLASAFTWPRFERGTLNLQVQSRGSQTVQCWYTYCSLRNHGLEYSQFFLSILRNVIGKILGQYFKLLLYVFLPNVRIRITSNGILKLAPKYSVSLFYSNS